MYFPNDIFPYFTLLHIVYECLSSSDIYISIYSYIIFLCPSNGTLNCASYQGQPRCHAKDFDEEKAREGRQEYLKISQMITV